MSRYQAAVTVFFLLMVITACSESENMNAQPEASISTEKMSDEWCEEMMVKPNKEWVEEEILLFGRDCTYADSE